MLRQGRVSESSAERHTNTLLALVVSWNMLQIRKIILLNWIKIKAIIKTSLIIINGKMMIKKFLKEAERLVKPLTQIRSLETTDQMNSLKFQDQYIEIRLNELI